jgi:hypothetical protein
MVDRDRNLNIEEDHLADAVNNHGAFVWSIAELLRGDYKQSEYQKVVLPLVVIRRLDTSGVLRPGGSDRCTSIGSKPTTTGNPNGSTDTVTASSKCGVKTLGTRQRRRSPSCPG